MTTLPKVSPTTALQPGEAMTAFRTVSYDPSWWELTLTCALKKGRVSCPVVHESKKSLLR